MKDQYMIKFRINLPDEKKRVVELALVHATEFEFARRKLCAWFNETHLNESSSIEILSKYPWDGYSSAAVYL